jgi:phage terminase large subunit GpA-like protein
MVIFGAVANNAPVLSKPKAQDVNWRGNYNKRGVHIQHVGTVAIKNVLFGRLATDGDKDLTNRLVHFSEHLPPDYFTGITSETYDPRSNRFVKKRGARNEPLDTWVYSYAAAHHQELRLHLHTQAKWNELLAHYSETNNDPVSQLKAFEPIAIETPATQPVPQTQKQKPVSPLTSDSWSSRL